MRKVTLPLLACTTLLLVTGCGGGDGQGPLPTAGNPSPAPTPSPGPTPTPTQTAVIAPAPFGLKQDAAMAVLGLVTASGDTRWIKPGDVQMTWLSSPHTFSMTLPSYGEGMLGDDPDEAAAAATVLIDGQGTRLAAVNVFVPTTPVGADGSVLWAGWSPLKSDSRPDATSGMVLYFTAASIASPPASGGASYRFGAPPDSQAKLTVDFAAGTVTGEVPLTYSDAWSPYPEVRYSLKNGVYDRTTGAFSGTFDIPGSGFSGEVRGQIVGSAGQAMAIVIRGAVLDPYRSEWVAQNSLLGRPRD